MHLELTEKVVVQVPPGTEQAIAEVASRREVAPDEYIRDIVLKSLKAHTGFSAVARARELQHQGSSGAPHLIAA